MKRWLLLVSVFMSLVMLVSCSSQSSLKPPSDSSGNAIPLYPDAQTLTVSQSDSEFLITDLLGSEYLGYSSNTQISITEDTATQVQGKLDELVPDAKWRLESDWFYLDQFIQVSFWRTGDLRASIITIDNLNSEQINDLNRYYGLSGLEPGATLIITHIWDTTKVIPTSTPTETPVPSPTPLPTETPIPSPTPKPSDTPTPSPSPTVPPDTVPGTILEPGEVWYQGGMEMRLKNPTFIPGCNGILGFEITLVNNTGGEIVTNISGLDFSIADNVGQSYSDVWISEGAATQRCYSTRLNRMEIRSMAAGQRIDLAFRVLGEAAQNVTQFTVTVYEAGRIQNAVWVIDVPR